MADLGEEFAKIMYYNSLSPGNLVAHSAFEGTSIPARVFPI